MRLHQLPFSQPPGASTSAWARADKRHPHDGGRSQVAAGANLPRKAGRDAAGKPMLFPVRSSHS